MNKEALFTGLTGRPHRRFHGSVKHWEEGRKARLKAEAERIQTGTELAPRPQQCIRFDASHKAGWDSVSYSCIAELTHRLVTCKEALMSREPGTAGATPDAEYQCLKDHLQQLRAKHGIA